MSEKHEYPASLIIDSVGLCLITYGGRPMMLVYGDGDRATAAVAELFAERYGRAPRYHEEPYTGVEFQAIGGHHPQEGDRWQLTDGRQMMIMKPIETAVTGPLGDQVPAQWVRMIGYHGAPAFFPEILHPADLDGARPWE